MRRVENPLEELIGRGAVDELESIRRELLAIGDGYGEHVYGWNLPQLNRDTAIVWLHRRLSALEPSKAEGGTE